MLIGGVSDFMNGGKDRGSDIVFDIFRGGAAVILAYPVGEGMLGLVLIAPV